MKARFLPLFAIALFILVPGLAMADIVSKPLITPDGGVYFDSVEVAIFTATPLANIYYTTDGTDPTTGSTPFTLPFTITSSTTVKAIAVKTGEFDSFVSTSIFTISPTPVVVTPTITVSGKKSLKTTKTSVKIKGVSTGATSVEYQVNDGDYKTASGTAAWSFKAKLKPGKNTIYVYAIGEDEDSDPAKISVTVTPKK